MKIVILASGSKGNATYIETQQTKILIDAGISYLQIRNRLANQGINITTLDAIFISHEHTDHISQLPSLLKRTNATLYINKNSYIVINQKKREGLNGFKVKYINEETKYTINDLVIVPIKLSHDAVNCYGFLCKETTSNNNHTFASVTDTGFIPERYFRLLSSINTILIESNHDLPMLKNSGRHPDLIYRIMSNHGHLSNNKCSEYLQQFISINNKNIILAHLSEDCNRPEIAVNNILTQFKQNIPFNLMVAKQYEELPIIILEDNND